MEPPPLTAQPPPQEGLGPPGAVTRGLGSQLEKLSRPSLFPDTQDACCQEHLGTRCKKITDTLTSGEGQKAQRGALTPCSPCRRKPDSIPHPWCKAVCGTGLLAVWTMKCGENRHQVSADNIQRSHAEGWEGRPAGRRGCITMARLQTVGSKAASLRKRVPS